VSALSARSFRLSPAAYFLVLFVAIGVTPLVRSWPLVALYLIPIAVAIFIRRTATFVDDSGIAVRALLGERRIPWTDIRGLSVTGRNIYAVTTDGSVRLPCVRLADLTAVSQASGAHLPELPEPTLKYAPQRRRR
jgi:hypothetical protein